MSPFSGFLLFLCGWLAGGTVGLYYGYKYLAPERQEWLAKRRGTK